jgi:peptidyl-tRNA hydrolase
MNYNSSEEIVKRASQSDPIIMYLIVKESLNMGSGKTAAQCAHASQMLLLKYLELKKCFWNHIISLFKPDNKDVDIFEKWLKSSFRKVVLT